MNCTESQDLLQLRLDGQAIPDRAALAQHLADCAECRWLHAAAGRLDDGLRLMPPPVPPPGLRTRIVQAALKDRISRRRRIGIGMAVAASIAIALWVGLLVSQSAGGWAANPVRKMADAIAGLFSKPVVEDHQIVVLPSAPVPVRGVPDEKAPSLRGSMAEVGTAMVSLTRRTADETVEQTRILTEVLPMPMNVFEAVPPMPEQPIATAWQGTSQRVASGFEPVTSSARRALSMLLRENPRPVNQ